MMEPSYDQDVTVKNDVVHITEFTKRELGRIIINECGNEGCIDSDEKKSKRRLLQEMIDYLPQQNHRVWKNATVTIYDIKGNTLEITSGSGVYQFFVNHNEKGESTVYPKQLGWMSFIYAFFKTVKQPFSKKAIGYTPSSSVEDNESNN